MSGPARRSIAKCFAAAQSDNRAQAAGDVQPYHADPPPDADWLVIAGQVGVNAKGRLAGGVRQQAEQAFRNIVACLRANKMKKEHLVKLTRNLFDRREVAAGEFGYTTVLNAGTLAYPLVPGSKAMKHGVVTAALVLCVAWSAQADLDIGTYHALIIGNNDYPYRCIPYSPAVGSMAERRHRRCLLLIPQAERGGTLKSPASQGEAVAALRDGTLDHQPHSSFGLSLDIHSG